MDLVLLEGNLYFPLAAVRTDSLRISARATVCDGAGLPTFLTEEFDAFLSCGILAHGSLRLRCDGCMKEKLVAFSSKRCGICPSCGT